MQHTASGTHCHHVGAAIRGKLVPHLQPKMKMDGEANFEISMTVRDYECDIQGIVNNGVYQHYLEHARHEYLKQVDNDFAEYARQGIHLIVVRAELDYKAPLQSGDTFTVTVKMVRESRVKFAFLQEIYRAGDRGLVLSAKIIGTALNSRGRPEIPPKLNALLPFTE